MPSSRMTATTSGWTRSAGVVPAERARWRPPPACSKRAADICERPAFWRQTKSAVAMAPWAHRAGLRARTMADAASACTRWVSRISMSVSPAALSAARNSRSVRAPAMQPV